MQFSLQTLMLIFVVVAAAVGLFGISGMVVSAVVLACAGYIRMSKDPEMACYRVVVGVIFVFPFLCCLGIPLLMALNEAVSGYLQLDHRGIHYSVEPRFPYAPWMSPVWKIFLSLIVLIGTTVLIIRRPLPKSIESGEKQEQEIRWEDTSEPEGQGEHSGTGDSEQRT
jgi:hypothetical protein